MKMAGNRGARSTSGDKVAPSDSNIYINARLSVRHSRAVQACMQANDTPMDGLRALIEIAINADGLRAELVDRQRETLALRESQEKMADAVIAMGRHVEKTCGHVNELIQLSAADRSQLAFDAMAVAQAMAAITDGLQRLERAHHTWYSGFAAALQTLVPPPPHSGD